MAEENLAPGWYPTSSGRHAYWDGQKWLPDGDGPPRSASSSDGAQEDRSTSRERAIGVGVLILAGIGLVMSMQSASLLTGTGSIWIGVALAGAGVAASYFLGAAKIARLGAIVMLVLALFNAGYMEKQMNDKRNEISNMFNTSP